MAPETVDRGVFISEADMNAQQKSTLNPSTTHHRFKKGLHHAQAFPWGCLEYPSGSRPRDLSHLRAHPHQAAV
jgi:hypothetical protein